MVALTQTLLSKPVPLYISVKHVAHSACTNKMEQREYAQNKKQCLSCIPVATALTGKLTVPRSTKERSSHARDTV